MFSVSVVYTLDGVDMTVNVLLYVGQSLNGFSKLLRDFCWGGGRQDDFVPDPLREA